MTTKVLSQRVGRLTTSKNIRIRCTKDGCTQITVKCIALTYTCVAHRKTYPEVLCTCSHTIRERMAYDCRVVDSTTAREKQCLTVACMYMKRVVPVACQVILEPVCVSFVNFESRRVHTRKSSWEIFLAHELTCGKRESVSLQHLMKNRRAVGFLNPMRDKNGRQGSGGRRGDTCDRGLSRSWKVCVC